MPIPVADIHTPELQRLLLLLETNLHFIVRQPLSREQAIDIRLRMSRPMGMLVQRFDLKGGRPGERVLTLDNQQD